VENKFAKLPTNVKD